MARMQHYLFAHKRLPKLFHQNPLRLIEELRSDQAQEFLVDFWEAIADNLELDEEDQATSTGLNLISKEEKDYGIIVISLPPPQASPEAYFIGLWMSYSNDYKKTPFRYFTLELENDLDEEDDQFVHSQNIASQNAVFCEWTETGEHINYDKNPTPTVEKFIETIESLTGVFIAELIEAQRPLKQNLSLEPSAERASRQFVNQTETKSQSLFVQELSKMMDDAQFTPSAAKGQAHLTHPGSLVDSHDLRMTSRLIKAREPLSEPDLNKTQRNAVFSQSELQEIAKYHRLLLWSVLLSIVLVLARLPLGHPFSLMVTGLQIVSLYQLGKVFRLSGLRMALFIFGLFIPLANLVILLLMHQRVVKTMKMAGVKVGFMGANPKTI